MRPERPVHQTLRELRTLTVTLDETSAGHHLLTPFPMYPCVLDVPTTSTTKRMRPDAVSIAPLFICITECHSQKLRGAGVPCIVTLNLIRILIFYYY